MVSVWQASSARKSAKEAVRVKAQLIDKRKASELARVQTVCKEAVKSMGKYGPASAPSSLTGTSAELYAKAHTLSNRMYKDVKKELKKRLIIIRMINYQLKFFRH